MIDEIQSLEKLTMLLEPNEEKMHEISSETGAYLNEYVVGLHDAKGFIQESAIDLPSIGNAKSFSNLLNIIDDAYEDGINSASGRHLGFIPGGGLWISGIADYIAAVTNKYAGVTFSAPGAAKIDKAVIEWMVSVVGYPETAYGDLTSGGSTASLIAIQTARDAFKIDSQNVRSSVIYVSTQTHHSTKKALHTTGLDEAILKIIPVDEEYRMDLNLLQKEISLDKTAGYKPFLIIASAGTTDTGAVDDLSSIAAICEKHDIWFHVDAAYGGFFVLTDEGKKKMKGIERSDSLIMDPHKSLFIPYGSGAVLIRNRKNLLDSFSFKANYLHDVYAEEVIDPADTGLELSRHNRALRIWLPLQFHGVEVFEAALKEKLLLCRYFYQEISNAGFETGPSPHLSVCIFRYPEGDENVINQNLVDDIKKDGTVYLSSTMIKGKIWIRCAILSHRTHFREIDLCIKMIIRLKQKVAQHERVITGIKCCCTKNQGKP